MACARSIRKCTQLSTSVTTFSRHLSTSHYPTITTLHHTDSPVTHDQLDALKQFVQSCRHLTVLTGAGISTESGISDYRSPGRPAHKPMQHSQFMHHDSQRRRYWARSYVGYMTVWRSKPNAGHVALAYAQQQGRCAHIITQNVDGLHQAAGATDVTELHGSIHSVVCTSCQQKYKRQLMQQWLTELNPDFNQLLTGMIEPTTDVSGTKDIELAQQALQKLSTANEQRPDGDVELGGAQQIYSTFNYPACPSCNGILKADVVFFGANVPKHVHAECDKAIDSSDGLLVVGSSLAVWSAYRLVRSAVLRSHNMSSLISASQEERERLQHLSECSVGIVNDGPTRADAVADVRIHGRAGQVLPWLFDVPQLEQQSQADAQAYMDFNREAQEAPL